MATGTILLWPGAISLPDGTSGNAFCQAQVEKSTGTAPTNGPSLFFTELLFDAATDEHCFFTFTLPSDYSSGGIININWKRASLTTAVNVVWKAAVAAEVPNSKALNTVATTTACSTTSQALVTTAITLTMDSAAVGDMVTVMLGRDADNASDTLTVDAQVTDVNFTYTTT